MEADTLFPPSSGGVASAIGVWAWYASSIFGYVLIICVMGSRYFVCAGVDSEFQMAMEYFLPVYGSPLLDISCGSGLFTRRFLKSGKFSKVIASDFSESMLSETEATISQDSLIDKRYAARDERQEISEAPCWCLSRRSLRCSRFAGAEALTNSSHDCDNID